MIRDTVIFTDLRKRQRKYKLAGTILLYSVLLIGIWRLIVVDVTLTNLSSHERLLENDLLHYVETNGFKDIPVVVKENTLFDDISDTVAGSYSAKNEVITLYTNKIPNSKRLIQMLYHEYGHHIYSHIISEEEKGMYVTLYLNNTPQTQYGLESGVVEDFSESYMLWQTTDALTKDKTTYFEYINAAYGNKKI